MNKNTNLTPSNVESVADSASFRSYSGSADIVLMSDEQRGGLFKPCIGCSADQYMIFSDSLNRKWERFNHTAVYPEFFGALGNGIKDDRSSLERAMVYKDLIHLMSNKVYKISTLLIPSGQKIIGNNAIIRPAVYNSITFYILKKVNIEISDVFFQGILQTDSALKYLGSDCAIRIKDSGNVNISRCTFTNYGSCGIYTENADNVTIDNNTFYNIGDGSGYGTADIMDYSTYGAEVYGRNLTVTNNKLLSNNDIGFSAAGGGLLSLIFTGNTIYPTYDGINKIHNPNDLKRRHGMMYGYNPSPYNSASCIIANNFVENTLVCGLYVNYISNVLFDNNISINSGLIDSVNSGIPAGFRFTSCRGVVSNSIVQNFQGRGHPDIAGIGVVFHPSVFGSEDSADHHLIIKNCIVRGSTNHGLSVGSPKMGPVRIEGCNFSDYEGNGIRLAGAAAIPSPYSNRIDILDNKFIGTKSVEPDLYIRVNSMSTQKGFYRVQGNNFYSVLKKPLHLYYFDPFASLVNSPKIAELILKDNEFNNARKSVSFGLYYKNDTRTTIKMDNNTFADVDTCFSTPNNISNIISGRNIYQNVGIIAAENNGIYEGLLKGENVELIRKTPPSGSLWIRGDIVNRMDNDTLGYIYDVGGAPGTWTIIKTGDEALPFAANSNQVLLSDGPGDVYVPFALQAATNNDLKGISVVNATIGLDIDGLSGNVLTIPSNSLDFNFPAYSAVTDLNSKLTAIELKNVIIGATPNPTDFVINTASIHVPGVEKVVIYDADLTTIEVTLGQNLIEGDLKIYKSQNNSVNNVIFSPAAGITLYVDGKALPSSSSFNATLGECISAIRYGSNIIINK